ncbi:MAG TPA: HAD family hydrolase [Burkholderiaceae bacterium]|nr:HAD family hydrolase [Burkholderiaceae bacterium]
MRLALFDLDHTLLSGDSDVLWCSFLIRHGLLDPSWRERCDRVAERYVAGTTAPQEYCDFHASLLAGRGVDEMLPLRRSFLEREILPRIPEDARALLKKHRDAGDRLVLTTATNRVVSEFTAQALAVDDYVPTELEVVDARYTGRTLGIPNLRVGKVERLRAWLAEQGLPGDLLRQATFYSDSINDLPLFSVVRHPIVVDPDLRLASTAARKGWTVLKLRR